MRVSYKPPFGPLFRPAAQSSLSVLDFSALKALFWLSRDCTTTSASANLKATEQLNAMPNQPLHQQLKFQQVELVELPGIRKGQSYFSVYRRDFDHKGTVAVDGEEVYFELSSGQNGKHDATIEGLKPANATDLQKTVAVLEAAAVLLREKFKVEQVLVPYRYVKELDSQDPKVKLLKGYARHRDARDNSTYEVFTR